MTRLPAMMVFSMEPVGISLFAMTKVVSTKAITAADTRTCTQLAGRASYCKKHKIMEQRRAEEAHQDRGIRLLMVVVMMNIQVHGIAQLETAEYLRYIA